MTLAIKSGARCNVVMPQPLALNIDLRRLYFLLGGGAGGFGFPPSRAWEKHHPEQLLESHEVRALQVDAGDPVDASSCHSSVSESVTIGKNSIISTSEAGIRICETPAIEWRWSLSSHSHSSIRKC